MDLERKSCLKLTKRAVEALSVRERPYDVRDEDLRGFLVQGRSPAVGRAFFSTTGSAASATGTGLGSTRTYPPREHRGIAQAIAGDVAPRSRSTGAQKG